MGVVGITVKISNGFFRCLAGLGELSLLVGDGDGAFRNRRLGRAAVVTALAYREGRANAPGVGILVTLLGIVDIREFAAPPAGAGFVAGLVFYVFDCQRAGDERVVRRVGFAGYDCAFKVRVAADGDVEAAFTGVDAGLLIDAGVVGFTGLRLAVVAAADAACAHGEAAAAGRLLAAVRLRVLFADDVQVAADSADDPVADDLRALFPCHSMASPDSTIHKAIFVIAFAVRLLFRQETIL